MTMTETPAAPTPKKRKYASRRKRLPSVAPKVGADLAGLTINDCPKACGVHGCVISGNGVCGHPRKGGLQGRTMHDNAAVARLNQAQKMLGKRAVDARFK